MGANIRSIGLSIAGLFFLIGCNQFVPLLNPDIQPIESGLTSEQVSKAIRIGGVSAGWVIEESGSDRMIGTLSIRMHQVIVVILYDDSKYSINYKSSRNMKIFCTERDKNKQNIKITGNRSCPGYRDPKYIHKAYDQWIKNLDRNIKAELIRAS